MKDNLFFSLELITPDKAAKWLESNKVNRPISLGSVQAYANDIMAGKWDIDNTSFIAFDNDGILRDGQHRLMAICKAHTPAIMRVCYGVSPTAIFDNNRPRSVSDQLKISRPDLPRVFSTKQTIAMVKALIIAGGARRKITTYETLDFIENHKTDLETFFGAIPTQTCRPKLSVTVVFTSLFIAYVAGVPIEKIVHFYDVLISGMTTDPSEYPIIAYRDYLLRKEGTPMPTLDEIEICEVVIKNFVNKNCRQRLNKSPKELCYPFPYMEERTTK